MCGCPGSRWSQWALSAALGWACCYSALANLRRLLLSFESLAGFLGSRGGTAGSRGGSRRTSLSPSPAGHKFSAQEAQCLVIYFKSYSQPTIDSHVMGPMFQCKCLIIQCSSDWCQGYLGPSSVLEAFRATPANAWGPPGARNQIQEIQNF